MLKEKKIIKELRKYINDELYDIELDYLSGTIICTYKNSNNAKGVKKEADSLGYEYTIINLVSLSQLQRELFKDFKSIKYVFDNKWNYKSDLNDNLIIKGDADVSLRGRWFNTKSLRVEANNIEIKETPNSRESVFPNMKYEDIESTLKLMPSESLNLIAKNNIDVDSSIVGIDEDLGTVYLYANKISINKSDFLVEGGNLLLYSKSIDIKDSYVGANNLYLLNTHGNINSTNIKTSEYTDMKVNELSIIESSIDSNKISITSNSIKNSSNSIIGIEEVVINDASCDLIEKVASKKITYNEQNMMQSQSVLKAQTRQDFIKLLKKLKVKSIESRDEAIKEIEGAPVKKLINPKH